MEYLDFDLGIEGDGAGNYRAIVLRSPAGEARGAISAPVRLSEIEAAIRALVESRGPDRSRDLAPVEPAAISSESLRTIPEYGRDLFDALMPSEVLGRYRVSLDKAREQKKGLRLRLRIEAPELASLPWEYAFDHSEGRHVSLSPETPVVRYLEINRPPQTLTVQPPLRVLGMIAAPNDRPQLDVQRERQQMARSIEHLLDKGAVTLEWIENGSWRELQRAMRKGPWHVFHFIGHGGFDRDTGLVALCDDDGKTFPLAAADLGLLLVGHQSLRLVVLNSCEGGRSSSTDLFSGVGSALIRQGVPAAISMQFTITDRAALEFSRTFYEALVEGTPVDGAVTEARKAIKMASRSSEIEWGTPVLHMHSLDGRLFDLDIVSAIFPPRTAPSAPKQAAKPVETSRSAPSEEAQTGQQILARKVRQFWINGVLENSLFRAAQIDLGLERMAGAVSSPWTTVLEEAGRTSQPLPAGTKVSDVFSEEGASLLILGEPGSGKTTTMLGLLRDLLAAGEQDRTRAVPVVFNLSSWADGQALDEWLVSELSTKYQIPKKVGKPWLDAGNLLPLLDGLDEVPGTRRAACVTAINTWTQSGGSMGMVVCCRLKEYIELPNRLGLNVAIRLSDLSREQVLSYVTAAGAPLAGLHAILQRDSDFLIQARSPLMLSLMVRTYQDVPVETLATEVAATSDARRKSLMDAYVARMFKRAAGGGRG